MSEYGNDGCSCISVCVFDCGEFDEGDCDVGVGNCGGWYSCMVFDVDDEDDDDDDDD